MKLPHRYSFPDPYITEELRKQYNSASSERRLRLLAKLNKEKIPYGVAVLAVQDPDARVRAWFAKNAVVLRYEPKEQGGECHDFEATLASDNDPYVNACLYENPMGPGGVQNFDQAMRVFGDAKPLSRLALVRNCNVSLELIEQIFRFDEPKLGISLNERSELVRAFLTNHKVIAQSHKDSFDFADGFAWFTTTRHFNTGVKPGASAPNRFYMYGVIGRLAMLAAAYELEATDPDAENFD